MTFISRKMAGAAVLALASLPVLAVAQRGGGPRGVGPRGGGLGNPIASLIDMRRELDLSSRQLVALDSIERTLIRRNRDVMQRIESRRDTTAARRVPRDLSEDERAQLRTRMQARRDSLQPLLAELRRNDSTAREAALRVLTDSQRVRVREFQAERRGFARGQGMARRGLMERGFGGRGGMRWELGPRGRFAPRGSMGPRGFGPGLRRPDTRPGVQPDELGPRRFRNRLEPAPRRRPPVEADSGRIEK